MLLTEIGLYNIFLPCLKKLHVLEKTSNEKKATGWAASVNVFQKLQLRKKAAMQAPNDADCFVEGHLLLFLVMVKIIPG